jgi:hypothetical protein
MEGNPCHWNEQLLPFETVALSTSQWESLLSQRLGTACHVAYGRSRSTPVQLQKETGQPMQIRLHKFFEEAPDPVIDALARWIHAGARAKAASQVLDAWIADALAKLPRKAPPPQRTRGNTYDLASMMQIVLQTQVPELLPNPPAITWGPRRRSKSRRSLHLGTFDPANGVIRIHPVLDHPSVPASFVQFVIFHELLHAVIPPGSRPGSRHHPAQFRARERAHPQYEFAIQFEEQQLDTLIRRARRGYEN